MSTNMFKIIITLALVISLSQSTACSKRANCPIESICCRRAKGYGCCAGVSAVCCADGKSCCPGTTTCDLKLGKCIPKKIPEIGFLYNVENFNKISEMANATYNITFNDTAEMVDGFFFALNISSYVKSFNQCKTKNFNLGYHLIDLVYSIKDFSEFVDTQTALSVIFRDFGDVLNDLYDNYKSCQHYPEEFSHLFTVLSGYFSNPNFFRSFYNNLVKNMYFFLSVWARAKSNFDQQRYFEAGKSFGELVSLVIFPEIEKVVQVSQGKTRNFNKLLECFVSVASENKESLEKIWKNFSKPESLLNEFDSLKNEFTLCINK